jgi:hypothetical protein
LETNQGLEIPVKLVSNVNAWKVPQNYSKYYYDNDRIDYVKIYKDFVAETAIKDERPYLVNEPYCKTIFDLAYYVQKIKSITLEKFHLQVHTKMNKLYGVPDIVTEDNVVIDLKFVSNLQFNIMQIFIYCVLFDTEYGELWNFRGNKIKFKFNKNNFKKVKEILNANLV